MVTVPPGRWRLQSSGVTSFCLGGPAFDVVTLVAPTQVRSDGAKWRALRTRLRVFDAKIYCTSLLVQHVERPFRRVLNPAS